MSTQPTYDCSHMYNPFRFDSEAGRAARLRILAISESQQRFEPMVMTTRILFCDVCQQEPDEQSGFAIRSHIGSDGTRKELRICELCAADVAEEWESIKKRKQFSDIAN